MTTASERRKSWRRFSIWFCINLIIFVACYLNYRLQLKHRYLYRTLSVGLCLSRAAAMVINFNLLLVWLPMCKHWLTWFACLATRRLRAHELKRQQLIDRLSQSFVEHSSNPISKLKSLLRDSLDRLQLLLLKAKMHSLDSFLLAVDHCTSLHTTCATTITIASVIHTIAHLMNVINFSNKFDPLLGNLNMAAFRGQNPFQLLVSVPGITGVLMILILILMSLSSVNLIRNSSFDLFQLFHRLSVIFVLLLFLHPSSHVLKEQANVERHHPELCYDRMLAGYRDKLHNGTEGLAALPLYSKQEEGFTRLQGHEVATYHVHDDNDDDNNNDNNDNNSTSQDKKPQADLRRQPNTSEARDFPPVGTKNVNITGGKERQQVANRLVASENVPLDLRVIPVAGGEQQGEQQPPLRPRPRPRREITSDEIAQNRPSPETQCPDMFPLFVAQSSICCYVLSFGLSCYLLDLLLRKWRRSKCPIQLLRVRTDQEGNLIELVMSNNHRRFKRWLPGQFVYLNCPQVASFEWHPFTISSMSTEFGGGDHRSKPEFTLHIKTGGDWTRKLRRQLELRQQRGETTNTTAPPTKQRESQILSQYERNCHFYYATTKLKSHQQSIELPNFDCYNQRTGKLEIQCTRLARLPADGANNRLDHLVQVRESKCLDLNASDLGENDQQQQQLQLNPYADLHLYIDGPFHSPFERLLDQQVSVCIANGVGWTAFSSVFQCITATASQLADDTTGGRVWWSPVGGKRFATDLQAQPAPSGQFGDHTTIKFDNQTSRRQANLHLMVIVTSLEQLRPFYNLALNYFYRITPEEDPVREIRAFITRSTRTDDDVAEFCAQQQSLSWTGDDTLQINRVFSLHFGKPNFELYLEKFKSLYQDKRKISVYCCGSYQVKKEVRDTCAQLNKSIRKRKQAANPNSESSQSKLPIYSYHEENF